MPSAATNARWRAWPRAPPTLKYPTATERESPNKVLRERCQFSVIHRPVVTIPGVPTNFKKPIDLDIVRVATGGTYDDAGRRIGLHSAVSVRVIEREPCRRAAQFAFQLAGKRGRTVISSSKYTIQQATDGLFEEAVDEVARDYTFIKHERILFDALLAKLAMQPESIQVVVCPNEYGDFLERLRRGTDRQPRPRRQRQFCVSRERQRGDGDVRSGRRHRAGHRRQKRRQSDRRDLCAQQMLTYLGEVQTGQRLKAAVLACIPSGQTTRDLGGSMNTDALHSVRDRSFWQTI